MATDCPRISCCGTGPFNDLKYSLVNGQTYGNDEITITVPCPPGFICANPFVNITLPPNTVTFTPTVWQQPSTPGIPPETPGEPQPGVYEFNCGGETLSMTVAATGWTTDQITQVLDFLSQCAAQIEGQNQNPATPRNTLLIGNTEQCYTARCPEGETGDPVTVCISAGTYTEELPLNASQNQINRAQSRVNSQALTVATQEAKADLVCMMQCALECLTSQIIASAEDFQQLPFYVPSIDRVISLSTQGGASSASTVQFINPHDYSIADLAVPDDGQKTFGVYHPSNGRVYICVATPPGGSPFRIWKYEPSTWTLEATITSATANNGGVKMVADVSGGRVLILSNDGELEAINISTNAISTLFNTGGFSQDFDLDATNNMICISDASDVVFINATTGAELLRFTESNTVLGIGFCPTTGEFHVTVFLSGTVKIYKSLVPYSTNTTADFVAPSVGANVSGVMVASTIGMYPEVQLMIAGRQWEVVSVDSGAELTLKNINEIPSTNVTNGSQVDWEAPNTTASYAIAGTARDVVFDSLHNLMVIGFNPTGGLSYENNFLFVDPTDYSKPCNIEMGSPYLTDCRMLGLVTSTCEIFASARDQDFFNAQGYHLVLK